MAIERRAVRVRRTGPTPRLIRLDGDPLSLLGHELRNELAPIRGLVDTLRDRWDVLSKTERSHVLRRLEASAAALGETLENLLAVGSARSGTLVLHTEPFDLVAATKALVERAGYVAADVRFRVRATAGLPRALADPARNRQVLMNLLLNAARFSPADAVVQVEIARAGGGDLQVSVRDHGPGVRAEDVPLLFDLDRAPAPREGAGTGLGLHAAKRLVEAQGGQIWLERSSDGARFCYTVPAAPD